LDDVARRSFEATCLPHLRAAYNLARWLTRDEHDAEDLVQEAFLRATKYFESGPDVQNARAWLLRIVRNTFYTLRSQKKPDDGAASFDEAAHGGGSEALSPETLALRNADRELVRETLAELGVEHRETIVLRELEGLSYREIAEVTSLPIGTVMSRLARARAALSHALARRLKKELSP
jgi:RNA polymerase sigma-70 factor (ECF subfamily)